MHRTPAECYTMDGRHSQILKYRPSPTPWRGRRSDSPGRRLSWFQWLSLRCARPFVGRGQPTPAAR